MKRFLLLTSSWVAIGPLAATALAQSGSYPVKPVRVIVPFPPGGSVDLIARMRAE